MRIAVASGKGGTGKTLVATSLAATWASRGRGVAYVDADVEEPNGHLFLKPRIEEEEDVALLSPVGVDEQKCTRCGKCARACTYNAIAVTPQKVLFFPNNRYLDIRRERFEHHCRRPAGRHRWAHS